METRQENFEYTTNVITNLRPIEKIEKNEQNEQKIYNIMKRFMDIIGGIIGIIILIPLIIIVYIGNMISKDSGSVFYIQRRIGANGKYFKIYKFRTMVVGADKKLRKYLKEHPEEAKEYEKYKKLKSDPRITKFGMFLRKTSLDEFPQFINIIKGEMSLVGPRPYLLKEKKEMGKYYRHIIKCKPGLTCIWQVNGRSNVTFADRLEMDMEYIKIKNIKTDIKLILKTFVKIFKKEGAI